MLESNVEAMFLANDKFIPERKLNDYTKLIGKTVTVDKNSSVYAQPGGELVPPYMISRDYSSIGDFISSGGNNSGTIVSTVYYEGDIFLGYYTAVKYDSSHRSYYDSYGFISYFTSTAFNGTMLTLLFAKMNDKVKIGG